MTREIPISKNYTVKVSDEDYEDLKRFSWYAIVKDVKWRKLVYAARKDGNKTVLMHREVAKAGPGDIVHHKNGNGLDNQRSNLEVVDVRTNSGLRHHETTSEYPGVTKKSGKNPYQVDIKIDGKTRYIKRCKSAKKAGKTYQRVAALVRQTKP